MNALADKDCQELTACMLALQADEAEGMLSQLEPAWQLAADGKSISHAFGFDNYCQTMAFANVVAQIAHQQDHHPDMHIGYKTCRITYSTHEAGGLSLKDLICAAKINRSLRL